MMRAARRPRTVARRILQSYVILIVVFVGVAGWAVFALRAAAQEAELIRSGYLPLGMAIEDAVASQDNWNAQLNHITTATNPADIEKWFELAMRAGRPRVFDDVSKALDLAFARSEDPSVRQTGDQLLQQSREIESNLEQDREQLAELFAALDHGNGRRAEELRDGLVRRGNAAMKEFRLLRERVQANVDTLLRDAQARERLAIQLLVGLASLTALVAIVMALYAQRVLRPLSEVTERAQAVAGGDLTPREAVSSNDEIGELARTFESMVAAIAQANAELVRSERLAAVGTMAARVTHEIRNPLSSMALNLELLEEEPGQSEEAQTLVRAIKGEVDRLSALSDQYLSLARQQPLRPDEEDPANLIDEVGALARPELERHGARLRIELSSGLPKVHLDEGQIKQVLLNLIRNAREAMPEGGEVRLAVAPLADGIEIRVEDEGDGIPAEVGKSLFEPFFTTKPRGTGLGLAITRQIVESHGGHIRCEAREVRGTRFLVWLPRKAAADAPLDGGPPSSAAESAPG